MKKRRTLRKGTSKRLFTATAKRTHRFNMQPAAMPMRGGIRM